MIEDEGLQGPSVAFLLSQYQAELAAAVDQKTVLAAANAEMRQLLAAKTRELANLQAEFDQLKQSASTDES